MQPSAHDFARLQTDMDQIADGFAGTLGYCLLHRGHTPRRLHRRGDDLFPTASTIKTAILCEALHRVAAGQMTLGMEIPVTPASGPREGGGPAYYFQDDAHLPLAEWLHLMIALSDNTATIVLRNHLGQKNINRWLADNGFAQTRVLNGKETDALGLRALQRQYGLGVTTPCEMAQLFAQIADGKALPPAASERALRLLGQQYWDDYILAEVPPTVRTVNKTGAVDRSRSDVALVESANGPYILAVYTKDQKDTSWTAQNAGEQAIRALSRLVWRCYNPHDKWTPPPDAAKFYPAGG